MCYIQNVLASKRIVHFSHLTSRFSTLLCNYLGCRIYFHMPLLYAINRLFIKTVF